MKIFLSWSGDLSRELAEALRDWFPGVIQSVRPFFTPNDIEKGARWSKDIAHELEQSSFGIFCITKQNLVKPWIMFEAGALSKSIDAANVCPILFGVDNADLEGPLVQFQASTFSEADFKKLVKTINAKLGDQKLDDAVLTNVFEMWWPKLSHKVNEILSRYNDVGDASESGSVRSEREILEEILELTRLNSKNKNSPSPARVNNDNASALSHSIKNIEELLLILTERDDDSYLPIVREIFSPLKYLVETGATRSNPELDTIISKVSDLLN
jgi:hypothetical protein